MTLHMLLGDGEMPPKELRATLEDLRKRCQADNQDFWFVVQGKAEPTATDKTLMAWMDKEDVWYDVLSDGTFDTKVYTDPQTQHTAKRIAPKVVELMQTITAEGEDAVLLAMWSDDTFENEADRWLNDVGKAVQTAGFKVLALNDGLVEIDMLDEVPEPEVEAEAEGEPEAAPSKSKASKKAAAASPTKEEDTAAPTGEHTRESLGELDLPALKAIAANLGISLPPRTRMSTYIDAILGEGGPGEAEVEDAPPPSIEAMTEAIIERSLEADDGPPDMAIVVAVFSDGTVVTKPVAVEIVYSVLLN